ALRGAQRRVSMDRAMPDESWQDLTGALRLAVEAIRREPIPEQAMRHALGRACSQAGTPMRAGRRLRRGLVVCAAAAVLLAVIPWSGAPSCSWADVVQAVGTVSWLHSTSKEPAGGGVEEFWLSPAQGISADRWGKHVEFRDHK